MCKYNRDKTNDLTCYRGHLRFTLWLVVLFALSCAGCMRGQPIQTQAYEWRHKLYPNEPKRRDWFHRPKASKKLVRFRREYGHCASAKLRPHLRQLKLLTLGCTKVAHTFHAVGASTRVGYLSLVALGAIGGTAVLVGPILTTLKIESQSVDTGLLLTVAGAAVTATAVLWLQLSGVGKTSNESFTSNANMIRLIQQAETNWNTKVCHATTMPQAMLNANKILSELAKQCVKDVPGVSVNPNIAGAIKKQQGEMRSVITNYQALQRHMEEQQLLRMSQQTLHRLVRQIETTQRTMLKGIRDGAEFLRLRGQLKSLCAQAFGESRRLEMLRAQQQKTNAKVSLDEPAAKAVGSWGGICRRIPKYKRTYAKMQLQRELLRSFKQKRRLTKAINEQHKLLLAQSKGKATASQKRVIRGLCLQASFAHRRVNALKQQVHQGRTPPGPWAGICQLYGTTLSSLRKPLKRSGYTKRGKALTPTKEPRPDSSQ